MATPRRADVTFTWQDYLQLPESMLRHDLLDGELIVSPSPSVRHQRVLQRLLRQLTEQIADCGRGEVLASPVDVRLSDLDVVQPDVLVILNDNLARLGTAFLDGPPDLAVEVLSPGTARRDRGRKADCYARFGVREYWIVDPDGNDVEQRVLDGAAYRTVGVYRETIAAEVIAGVTVDLTKVW